MQRQSYIGWSGRSCYHAWCNKVVNVPDTYTNKSILMLILWEEASTQSGHPHPYFILKYWVARLYMLFIPVNRNHWSLRLYSCLHLFKREHVRLFENYMDKTEQHNSNVVVHVISRHCASTVSPPTRTASPALVYETTHINPSCVDCFNTWSSIILSWIYRPLTLTSLLMKKEVKLICL